MVPPASPIPPAPKSALVIANPIAGAGRGERLAKELTAELESAGLRVELKLTTARGDARKFAAGIAADALLCVGGDGTVNEVLHGLQNRDVPVGIMPLGTANVLAVDLSLSSDARIAARTVLEGRTTRLDTALVNGELSFLAVGVGFDAAAVREVELRRRGPISKLTYVGAGFRALWSYVEPVLEVEIDGVRAPGTFGWILVSNVIHYAGIFRLSPDRELGDGLWEVYLFPRAARRHLASHGLRALTGHLPGGSVERRQARHVMIRSASPVAVHVDGDFRGQTPLEISVSGPRFRIFCPARHARD